MSDRDPSRPPNTELPPSNVAENEYAPFNYDWSVPGPFPSGLPFSTGLVQGSEDLPGPSAGERSTNAKVAIPRSAQSVSWTSTGRTSRACENCREQKAKCSGHHPTCNRCKDAGIRCSYGDRKREKMIKQVNNLKAQVQSYEAILRELYPRLDSPSAQYVDQALSGQLVRPLGSPALQSDQQSEQQYSDQQFDGAGIYHPLAAIDHTEEDFNRDEKQALGFVGEHSEMTWLYRLKRDLGKDNPTPIGETPERPSISSLNYFHEDIRMSNLEVVDVLERPSQSSADKLVDIFLEVIHPAFPIIGKEIFLSQYRSFYSNPTLRPGKRWMAILNLVFALAAKHSLLVNEQPVDDDLGNPSTYFSRAWRLCLGNVALLDHPNLQQVQFEGLASFYLLATGQVNRSWRMIGIGIRSAVAMGLNLRSESGDISHISRETRYRVWWALFMLDTLLCVMIGRPPSTGTQFCTTPLPLPFIEEDFGDEGVKQIIMDYNARQDLLKSLLSQVDFWSELSDYSSDPSPPSSFGPGKGKQSTLASAQSKIDNLAPNTSLYFLYGVDLAFLMRKAIETLYAPGATRRSWLEMENAMATFNNSADVWLFRLPLEYRFAQLGADPSFAAQRTGLAFHFYTTKLVITQPCLRRLAYQPSGETTPGPLCHTMASICVQVARDMFSLLPDETDICLLYQVSPWWGVLHHMMQSTTIILVELFTRTSPGTMEAAGLIGDIKKAIRWLREMATRDTSSLRAWSVCMELLSQHGLKFALYVD
ncbi:hypothetical protein N7478_002406 [Penicillium angulare]|uniref:uncharacterized protein n=1 Tax=Penicillium angulare TaxID=116970 RepID=UPI0025423886|nr:uncharacterized protein N7478_002406 [Penicillium angulare]KAJ5286720.1 hypothetical protein N7478_002406 [Penicillium angulare]